MKTCWLIGALGLAACGGNARPAVVVNTAPASAAECPAGGAVVSSGADDNGNGLLDDAEVASRVVVCDDPPVKPPPTLVRLVAEPTGAHCLLAGTAIESGPDRNGNGVLDDDEVTGVEYACGEPLLTRLAAAPPDAQCVAGGVAFLAGRDRNHDGRLEDDEVEQREVACGDEVARDIAVHTADDAAALAGIAVITGSLMVDNVALGELAMPRLVQIRGGLEIKGNAALARVALPVLQTIDGVLALALDPQLTTLELPQLRRVGGLVLDGVAVSDLQGLAALAEVRGDVQISNDAALGALDLPPGRIDGDLTIRGNAQVTRVAASLHGRLGAVRIENNPQLTGIDLAGAAAGRLAQVGGVTMRANDALERVALDADDLGAIFVAGSTRLADVAVTGVGISGAVWMDGIGELRLGFTALAPDAFTIGGTLHLSGPLVAITSSRPLVVNRDCTLDMTHLTAFGPDVVGRVDGLLVLSNNPRLTSVATIPVGSLEVSGDHALTELDFDLGEEFGGQLTIFNNAILEAAPFDRLRVAGYAVISANPALKAVFGPSLERVNGDLAIFDNDNLSELGLVNLAEVGGIAIEDCDGLTEIDLPALRQVNIFFARVNRNSQLRHIRVPVLRFADFDVLGNPHLPACEVTAMFALIGGEHDQRFNDDTAVCTP